MPFLFFFFRVSILFDFVFPFPSTKKKNISCLFATPHSPSHTQEMKRKIIKKIFDRVRVVSICVHHVDPTHPSPAEKKGKKKVVGIIHVVYIITLSSPRQCQIEKKKLFDRKISRENKNKKNKKKYEQWTYVIYGKDVITRLVFTFSLFIARNKKYASLSAFFLFQ